MERGRPGDDFEIIDADGRPMLLEDYLRQRAASLREGAPLEIRYRRAGSMHDHWIQMKTAPIRDDSGAIQMTVFISRDITEQKRMFNELSRSRNELHQRVNERTAELASANQVLRNEVELRRQAEDELRAAVMRAEALARIAAHLNAQHDLREIVQSVCDEALRISPYETACVFLYDDKADHLYVAAAQGTGAFYLLQTGPAPRIWYEKLMANFGQALVVHDAQTYAHHPEFRRWVDAGTRTLVVMSMEHAGHFIGALMVSSHDKPHYPSEDDLVLLRGVANLGATSMAKGLLFQQLDEARQGLQEMSRKMLDIQDGERRYLAMELHDQVGQLLTSLGLSLEQAERQAQAIERNRGADLAGEIATARQQVREVLQQVREMSLRLRPAMLDELGLVPALLAHFERFNAASNIRVDFRHSGLYDRFPSSIENAVFRMVQESLTNVARYAGVQEVSVRLLAEQDLLVAQVRDQGIGFDPELRLAERASSGLSGMSERITLCGGQLTVESAPGQGTCLTAEFPIELLDRSLN
jgi:signal transduction histidine kinase